MLLEKILQDKLIAIVRDVPSEKIINVAQALLRGGISFIEIPLNSLDKNAYEDALKSIRLLSDSMGDVQVGAGTVLCREDVKHAKAAGARYIISPNTSLEVIRYTKEQAMLSMPGAYTPTEVQLAHEAGADVVKIFPADMLSPKYFKAIKAPLKHVCLSAVGGVTTDNAGEFLQNGADIIAVGSNLVNPKNAADTCFIELEARKYRQIINKLQAK